MRPIVMEDEEAYSTLKGLETAAKAARAAGKAFEGGAQMGVEAFNGMGFFFFA